MWLCTSPELVLEIVLIDVLEHWDVSLLRFRLLSSLWAVGAFEALSDIRPHSSGVKKHIDLAHFYLFITVFYFLL